MTEKTQDEKQTEQRRDEALRRALSTPPKPHDPKVAANSPPKSPPKRK